MIAGHTEDHSQYHMRPVHRKHAIVSRNRRYEEYKANQQQRRKSKTTATSSSHPSTVGTINTRRWLRRLENTNKTEHWLDSYCNVSFFPKPKA